MRPAPVHNRHQVAAHARNPQAGAAENDQPYGAAQNEPAPASGPPRSKQHPGQKECKGREQKRRCAQKLVLTLGLKEKPNPPQISQYDDSGGLARFSSILTEEGASVRSIEHDRAFASDDLSEVVVHCVIETRDFDHVARVRARLQAEGFRSMFPSGDAFTP